MAVQAGPTTAGKKTSVYLPADTAASVAESGVPLAELIRRGLAAGQDHVHSCQCGWVDGAQRPDTHTDEPEPAAVASTPLPAGSGKPEAAAVSTEPRPHKPRRTVSRSASQRAPRPQGVASGERVASTVENKTGE